MTLRQRIRTITGAATVCVLLGLIVADTLNPSIALTFEDKITLVALISATLGLDLVIQSAPLSIRTGDGGQDDE